MRRTSALRFLLFALLMLGVVVKPVLATECGTCEEAHAVLDAGSTPPSEAPPGDGDCCAVADCDDCCTQAVDVRTTIGIAPAVPIAAPGVTALAVDFKPIAVAVAFRPPIAG